MEYDKNYMVIGTLDVQNTATEFYLSQKISVLGTTRNISLVCVWEGEWGWGGGVCVDNCNINCFQFLRVYWTK